MAKRGRPYEHVRLLANVAIRVHETRRARKQSLRAFGAACGLSASHLSAIERGETGFRLSTIAKLAHACGVTAAELCSGEVPFAHATNDGTGYTQTYSIARSAGSLWPVIPAVTPLEALPLAARAPIGFRTHPRSEV